MIGVCGMARPRQTSSHQFSQICSSRAAQCKADAGGIFWFRTFQEPKDSQTLQRDDTRGFQGEKDLGSLARWAGDDPPLYSSRTSTLPVYNITSSANHNLGKHFLTCSMRLLYLLLAFLGLHRVVCLFHYLGQPLRQRGGLLARTARANLPVLRSANNVVLWRCGTTQLVGAPASTKASAVPRDL